MSHRSSEAAAPPLGRLYDVGGRRLALHRSGTGSPAVVFLPGAGLVGLDYLNIHDRTAELTTSVIYDRAGTGWSGPAQLPRVAAEVSGELHDLLHAAGVPAPYLLVGHSLGAVYARSLAARFPGEVAGLLLLDPFHEDMHALAPQHVKDKLAQMKQGDLPEATEEQIEASRGPLTRHFAKWPDAVRGPLIEHHLTAWQAGWQEDKNLYDVVADELRHGPGLPDVPMIVLTAGAVDSTQVHLWSEETAREINAAKVDLHARLAASVPRGEHRVLDDAGHGWIHEERQDAVLQAITDLLARWHPAL
ncbi:alpha/beta hydrolase fold precursor [Planotetraspora thailandica]|uniref:Alpha/beta hydrolase fold n=1 Tax=Planotetraspora thailandica TaxID=487172 RepID=A0A8J3UZE7_9ACTN|nr:alpha/beta hydrolase [Planotetraspora thailandica]GII53756.1 alpha/beta hydrolase fold precursor [Planotetraspora thailandica]